jgi:uncharacterized protein
MKNDLLLAALLSIITLFTACNSTPETTTEDNATYVKSINQWHQERLDRLKKQDGWLALAGLFWLEPGENSFGSGAENDLVFPEGKIAKQAGTFILAGNQVTVKLNEDAGVQVDGKTVQEANVFVSDTAVAPQLKHGSLTWFVIKRGDKYAVRLLDTESEIRTNFTGIDRFTTDSSWKVEATLEPNTTNRTIPITNVLGQTSQEATPGALVFKVAGKTYKLDVLQEGDQLFVIFADKTNGHETYGAGRYLYANAPDATGKTILDFNKATNPPCAFVSYATCPLPPKQNFLPIPVPAGEKAFEGSH